MVGLAACGGCCLATSNTPHQLGTENGSSIFTLSGVTHQQAGPRPSAPESDTHQQHHVPRRAPITTKIPPQGNGYPHSPSYPRNPHYPPDPPPSYTAASYPAPSGRHGRRVAGPVLSVGSRVVASPPTPHTIADLPPPYASRHHSQRR